MYNVLHLINKKVSTTKEVKHTLLKLKEIMLFIVFVEFIYITYIQIQLFKHDYLHKVLTILELHQHIFFDLYPSDKSLTTRKFVTIV